MESHNRAIKEKEDLDSHNSNVMLTMTWIYSARGKKSIFSKYSLHQRWGRAHIPKELERIACSNPIPSEALAKIASRAKFDDRKADLRSSQSDISDWGIGILRRIRIGKASANLAPNRIFASASSRRSSQKQGFRRFNEYRRHCSIYHDRLSRRIGSGSFLPGLPMAMPLLP